MTDAIHNPDEASDGVSRCDICDGILDPEAHDVVMADFGVPEEVHEKYGTTDQDAANAVADALSSVAEGEDDRLLAHTIRQSHEYHAHGDCLEKTNIDQLETG